MNCKRTFHVGDGRFTFIWKKRFLPNGGFPGFTILARRGRPHRIPQSIPLVLIVVLGVVFVVVFVDDNLHIELIATNTLVYWFVLYLLLVPKKKKKRENGRWILIISFGFFVASRHAGLLNGTL
jgi:hypothetical protein